MLPAVYGYVRGSGAFCVSLRVDKVSVVEFPGLQIVLLSQMNDNIFKKYSTIIPIIYHRFLSSVIYSVKMTFLFSIWSVRKFPLWLTTCNKVDIDNFDRWFWLAIDYGSERTEQLTFQTHQWDVLAERNPTPHPPSLSTSLLPLWFICVFLCIQT